MMDLPTTFIPGDIGDQGSYIQVFKSLIPLSKFESEKRFAFSYTLKETSSERIMEATFADLLKMQADWLQYFEPLTW